MSALGDYIHLNTSNYLKYGVSRQGEDIRPSLTDVINSQKAKNRIRIASLPSINEEILEELKERVKKHFPEGKDDAKIRAMKNAAEMKLAERFKTKILNGITGAENSFLLNSIKSSLENSIYIDTSVNIEEAKRIRHNIYSTINRMKNNPSRNTDILKLTENFNAYFRALGVNNVNDFVSNIDIRNISLRDALVGALHNISLAGAEKATVQGAWGEKVVALCDDAILTTAKNELNTVLNSIIVGSKGSSFKISEDFITSKVNKSFQEKMQINNNQSTNLLAAHWSQNKVDVKLTINDQALNASVKAYSTSGNIASTHLQDVKLLTSLATTVDHFANHWLNIHSLNLTNDSIDEALEEHIKYEALVSGNLLKQNTEAADTFVVIDVTNARVEAYSTKDILENKYGNFYMRPHVNTIEIKGNIYQKTLEDRIANMLMNFHSMKISVILNTTFDKTKNL